jgi:hypothetical protein
MSNPNMDFNRVKYLGYRFMASKAESAVKKLIEGEKLSKEDRSALKVGSDFLRQVANGVEIVGSTTNSIQNHAYSLTESMEALKLAIDPLQKLKDRFHYQDMSTILNTAANIVVQYSIDESGADIKDDELKSARLFEIFFDQFYWYLCGQTNQAKLIRERVGSKLPGKILS